MSTEITREKPLTEWPPAPGRKVHDVEPTRPTLYHVRGCVDGRVVVRCWYGRRWCYVLLDAYWFNARSMLADGVFKSALELCYRETRETR